MSAFICNPDHIGQLAIQCHKWSATRRLMARNLNDQFDHLGRNLEAYFAHHLALANWESVRHRYDDKAAIEMSGFASFQEYAAACASAAQNDHCLSPIQLIKMFECFKYQSCEDPLFGDPSGETMSVQYCDAAISNLISDISGYEEAAWEYTPHVVVIDTLCDGWQAWKDEIGQPQIFCNQQAAEAEINADFEDLVQNQKESGMEPDEEPSEFAFPLSEYIEGRKAIFTGGQPAGYISGTQPGGS